MPVQKGNTTGSIALLAYELPVTIKSFSLVNRSGGSVTVTAYVGVAAGLGGAVAITPAPKTLAAGEAYISDDEIKILAGENIIIIASGSLDYYITFAD